MWSLIVKEIKERKVSLFAYALGTIAFVWLYVAIFPSIQTQAQNYNKILETMPKALLQAFGIETTGLNSIQSYLSTELYSLIWPILAIFYMVSQAGNAVAGEIDKATIGTLLSQPISRTRIFFAKYSSAFISYVVFCLATILCAIPLAAIYNIKYTPANYFTLLFLGIAFGLVIYSFALIISALSSDKTKVYAITGGLLMMMYVLNIVSGLKSNLAWLKYISIFHYFTAGKSLINNNLNLPAIGLFLGLTVIFTFIGWYIFQKRDISI